MANFLQNSSFLWSIKYEIGNVWQKHYHSGNITEYNNLHMQEPFNNKILMLYNFA